MRGRKKSKNPRSEVVKLRLTADEKRAVAERAERDGVTLTALIRRLLGLD